MVTPTEAVDLIRQFAERHKLVLVVGHDPTTDQLRLIFFDDREGTPTVLKEVRWSELSFKLDPSPCVLHVYDEITTALAANSDRHAREWASLASENPEVLELVLERLQLCFLAA